MWLVASVLLPVLLHVACAATAGGGRCVREPEGRTPKTPGDNGFRIRLSGNPEKYVPGEVYTVTLQGWRTQYSVNKFTGFLLVVEPSDLSKDVTPDTVGTFQLFGDAFTKFSEDCPSAVTQTSSIPKPDIQVLWTAPSPGTGCVKFKATVVEHRDVWYMDAGKLTKELCEEMQENQDEQPDIVDPCCACDEAKYEVTFQGLWSRHTHPKDFPTNEWLTHFSDIIGASHSADYRVWEYGGVASKGMKHMAEWGSTQDMESELKRESKHIRTIIKSRGLWYPRVNEKTFAIFRVDKIHHLMSLVSMLGPSPDWIVGVSALELCLRNCSWVKNKVLNLYPWDAGSDDGITYVSANSETNPPEKIRRITSSYPNDPRSPFYDPTGKPMKPVARLTITRQRLYEKSCSAEVSVSGETEDTGSIEDDDRPECRVFEWSEWSHCSASCGNGLRTRQRFYVNKMKATMMDCHQQLVENEMCPGDIEVCPGDHSGMDGDICHMTEWSQWSPCSVTCGKGHRQRTRRYLNHMGRKKCFQELMEKDTCMGKMPECAGKPEVIDPHCLVTPWSDWSPCSVTCGKGVTIRTRLYLVSSSEISNCSVRLRQQMECMGQKKKCIMEKAEAKQVCMQEKKAGPCRGYFPRWHFDAQKGMCVQFIYGGCRGNNNNFERYEDCNKMCELLLTDPVSSDAPTMKKPRNKKRNSRRNSVVHCMVTPWTEWSSCSVTCGRGWMEKTRMIKVQPQNGGKPCPQKLKKKKKCRQTPCVVDCVQGAWQSWSPCEGVCEKKGTQRRVREEIVSAKNGGKQCKLKVERRYCHPPYC